MKRIDAAIPPMVAVGLLGIATVSAAPERDYRFSRGNSALCIPFESASRHISIRAVVNGRDSLWLVLDSGAQGAVLDAERAAALGLEGGERQQSFGAGGQQEGSTVHGVNVALPGFELLDQSMDTLPLQPLSVQSGWPMEGILGHPVFERCVVEVDYAKRCLNLFEAEGWEYHGPGKILPLTFEDNLPYVNARLVLPGGQSIDGQFVIDTGGAGALVIAPDAVGREKVLDSVTKTLSVQARGIGGSVEVTMARIERLELGGFSLAQPIAALQPAGAGEFSASGTLGNIGGGILNRFKVIFDYRRKRMILEPAADFADPFESDMSGMGLVSMPPDYRRVRVARVMDDSPALEAGVQPGDEIETVNGTSVQQIGMQTLRGRLRRVDQDLQLELRRGTERVKLGLRTRRMI